MEIGERTGVELDEETIDGIDTVRDLLGAVAEGAESGEISSVASPLERPEEVLSDEQKRWLESLGPVESALGRGLFLLDRAVMKSLFRLRVEGIENLPEEGPFIVTPNHLSYLDPFAVAAALGYSRLRRMHWAGSMNVAFGNPLTRLVSRLAQAVPVESDRSGVSSLAFGASALERGKSLIWFPEGQRSYSGELQPFKPGVGLLLDHFRVPVVPVSISGTYAAMPPGRALVQPKKITVVFGELLSVDDLDRQGEGERPQDRIVQALRDRVAKLGDR
jgi:long-chain acyl-CoA synthetase